MVLKRPENFVAYHTNLENHSFTSARFKEVSIALGEAKEMSVRNNLQACRLALGWQALLEQADKDYQDRRYEQAAERQRMTFLNIINKNFHVCYP